MKEVNRIQKPTTVGIWTFAMHVVQLISGALEHSVLHVREIYALENVVFYIAVYGPYKPIIIHNTECSNAPEVNCIACALCIHIHSV